MYLSGLSAAELQRQREIAARLHWLGLAIRQAEVSGMFTEMAAYQRERTLLQAEEQRLAARARAEATEDQRSAEAGPLGINTFLADLGKIGKMIPVALGLGLFAYLAMKGRR